MNFQPIFDYLDKSLKIQKEEIIYELDTKFQGKFDSVLTAIDNLSGQVKEYRQEQIVSGSRIDRLENWANPAGDKLGLPISF